MFALNKPQGIIRNYSFVLGVVCLVIFMSVGFGVCLLDSAGQLMFSFVWFILAPVPFGVIFAIFAYKLRQKLQEKNRMARFSAFTLGIAMVLILWLFVLFMQWIEFWGVLRWM